MHRPAKYEISRRRRGMAIRSNLAFAVSRSPAGEPESLTVFVGRRCLTRALSPGEVSMLQAALSPEDR